ncbi:MAG: SH3 domain-containing protein [Lachnospiraceae bacterium]|nr:SH3 domain-containing protein [Lachnospiraceae bacterium]
MRAIYKKGAAAGLAAALVLSSGSTLAIASGIVRSYDRSMTAVNSDRTYGAGLDFEAMIINTVEQDERSSYKDIGIAVGAEYLEIREEASEEAEVIGKLYKDSGCAILSSEGSWMKISSGDIEGYVERSGLVTGLDAEQYAAEHSITELTAKFAEDVEVHEKASAESRVITTAAASDAAEVLGSNEDGKWLLVKAEEDTGYVASESVEIEVQYDVAVSVEEEEQEEPAPVLAAAPEEAVVFEEEDEEISAPVEEPVAVASANVTEVNEYVWASESVNIRAGAGTDYEKLGLLAGGSGIRRVGILDNDWSIVEYNGTRAYVKTEFLTTTAPETSNGSKVFATTSVNVRSGPSTEYDVIGSVGTGDSILAIAPYEDWYLINYDGRPAFVKAEFFTDTDPAAVQAAEEEPVPAEPEEPETPATTTAYATTYVNVRSNPSTSASILGTLSKGESIQKYGETDGWAKVDFGGTTAYIKAEFLSDTAPVEETTVEEPVTEPEPETETEPETEETAEQSGPVISEERNETIYALTSLNVRASDSASSQRIGVLYYGESVTRTGITSNGWSRIDYNGSVGYVSSDYVSLNDPVVTYADDDDDSDDTSIGRQIADYALQWVGYPYVYGGNDLNTGVDCSGFVQQVYLHFGYSVPRTATAQSYVGTSISADQLQPGDLVFYTDYDGTVGHVAIYIGNGMVVHASNPTYGIITAEMYYRSIYCCKTIVN